MNIKRKKYTYNGDGIKNCLCCEKKLKKKSAYGSACSFECSKKIIEYRNIPLVISFLKRIHIFISNENEREDEIEKFAKRHNISKDLFIHKMNRYYDPKNNILVR